jgi:hypothetical protein
MKEDNTLEELQKHWLKYNDLKIRSLVKVKSKFNDEAMEELDGLAGSIVDLSAGDSIFVEIFSKGRGQNSCYLLPYTSLEPFNPNEPIYYSNGDYTGPYYEPQTYEEQQKQWVDNYDVRVGDRVKLLTERVIKNFNLAILPEFRRDFNKEGKINGIHTSYIEIELNEGGNTRRNFKAIDPFQNLTWKERYDRMKDRYQWTDRDVAELIGNTPGSVREVVGKMPFPRWARLAILIFEKEHPNEGSGRLK